MRSDKTLIGGFERNRLVTPTIGLQFRTGAEYAAEN